MRPPEFWDRPDSLAARLLSPLGFVTATATARRLSRPGFRAPVPVICCGNAGVGGAGKTMLALELARRLRTTRRVHVLLRGYGGSAPGPRRVREGDDAALVGDEALLLAEVAPTWIGADRAGSARGAVADGAEILILDDGLQNPTLAKDLSLLVIDGGRGFGNGRLLPAGPLRETVAAAASRCQAAILIGDDRTGALPRLPPRLPVLRARIMPESDLLALRDRRVLAFAGIGRPGKFFATLEEAGAQLAATVEFADHHCYRQAEIERLLERAARLRATPVTTAKDAVRLPAALRAHVEVGRVGLVWESPAEIDALLRRR